MDRKLAVIGIIVVIVLVILSGFYYLIIMPTSNTPFADAGFNQTAYENDTVLFFGNGTDSDGEITLFEWDFDGDGIFDWQSTITGNTTYVYSIPGNYTALLQVTDTDGLTQTDDVIITIKQHYASLTFLDHRGFEDPQFVYEIVGEIQNTGTLNLKDVKITATFYDDNDNLVGYPNCTAFIDIIIPGQKSPFMVARYDASSYYVLEATWIETDIEPYHNYEVTNQTSEYITIFGQNGYEITGWINNTGNEIMNDINLVTTFYNSNNEVVAVAHSSAAIFPPILNPGEIDYYRYVFPSDYSAGTIDHYEIQIQCSQS